MQEKYYLEIGNAKDKLLKSPRDRAIYRFLEMLPGLLSWGTLFFVVLMSKFAPVFIAFFIIAFDIYWLLKTVFLSFHMRTSYKTMRRYMKIDWLDKLKNDFSSQQKNWQKLYHLIVMPFYKEPFDVLEKTLKAILAANYPKEKMIIVLGSEQRAGEQAQETARQIKEKYGDKFYKFLITIHPSNIVGELAGKGSNITFAGRQAKKEIVDALSLPYENIIVSALDCDTQIYPEYFGRLTYAFLEAENPYRSSFQPIPLFNNNIWEAPAISRVVATSGTFWHMMQQERPERLATFSSHAMSFKALAEVDFWNAKNVSEDSRIFWKCLLHYDGDYEVVPLFYPVSMDANLAPAFLDTMANIYRQQRRWGWGAENIAYVIFGFLKNRKISLGTKIFWTFNHIEGFWSWATNALILLLLGWLPLFLGGPAFNVTVLSYNLPQVTRFIMTLAMIGLISSAVVSTLLLPPRPEKYKKFRHLSMVLQWILLPVTILIFGALPGLEAQTRLLLGKYMGFWVTPKSSKSQIARQK
ncbi:MAG: glycosyltransferase family 2 protein [Candidatus Portnoybacteria bacterium]|nr:glycosyltransferase family 2 protein [Candidatus Portnoybacteria bacterium]